MAVENQLHSISQLDTSTKFNAAGARPTLDLGRQLSRHMAAINFRQDCSYLPSRTSQSHLFPFW